MIIEDLINLSEDELNEVLLDGKYNKANLRELVRRALSRTKTYKEAFEYQLSEKEKLAEEKSFFLDAYVEK